MKRMTRTVNVHEAKTQLSRLLAEVGSGTEVIIARAGKPVARLVSVRDVVRRRTPGRDKDKIWIADDFDAPLPVEVLDEFYR